MKVYSNDNGVRVVNFVTSNNLTVKSTMFPHIFNRWKNYFSQLLNVDGFSDVRQKEIHTAQPLMSQSS
jgi:hypothetical protein